MKNRFLTVFYGLFLAIALLFMIIKNNQRNRLLNSDEVLYTVGITTKIKYHSRVSPSIYYVFSTRNNEKIEGRISFKGKRHKDKYINKKFFVKYSTEKPIYSEIYLDKSVPDSLYNCTNCYWEKPPW